MFRTPLTFVDPDTGETIVLAPDTTVIYLFGGNNDLDHVLVSRDDDRFVACYDIRLLVRAVESRLFPIYRSPYRPGWAIERRLKQDPPNFDHLLFE